MQTKPFPVVRICRIAPVPVVFQFLLQTQIKTSVENGYEVFLVSSPGPELEEVAKVTGAKIHPLPIDRGISPWRDLKSLFSLYRFFRLMRFDIVHSMTPKAGLLTAVAGIMARIPLRVHTFTGQTWLTTPPPLKWILKFFDWLIVKINSRCYADSTSQVNLLVKHRITRSGALRVLGNGSIAGVDLQKFNRDKWYPQRRAIREELRISESAKVINFTGRMNVQKGICELLEAFNQLRHEKWSGNKLYLLMVGPLEEGKNQTPIILRQQVEQNENIRYLGVTSQPEKYLAAADLFCIPSYREGFGTAAIEAGAMGLASVGTRVIGLVDAIIDGETGLLVPPKDNVSLAKALDRLLDDDQLRLQMGQKARERATRFFDEKHINALMMEEYKFASKILSKTSRNSTERQ